MLSHGCAENITCVFDEEMNAEYEKFIMPDNSFCNQGPPTHVECYKGFTMSADGKCISKSMRLLANIIVKHWSRAAGHGHVVNSTFQYSKLSETIH